MTPDKVDLWCELLSDLSPSDLAPAFEAAAKTCTDFPTVADIRKAVEQIKTDRRESMRATGEAPSKAHEDCPWCGGSGWKPIYADYRVSYVVPPAVVRCHCTQPGFTLPPVEPRKQIEAAEFREMFKDAVKGREM